MSAQILELYLFGRGTVLRLERYAWSIVKRLRQATDEYPSSPEPSTHRPSSNGRPTESERRKTDGKTGGRPTENQELK